MNDDFPNLRSYMKDASQNAGPGSTRDTATSAQSIVYPEVTLVNTILAAYPAKCLSRPAKPTQTINATMVITINNFNGIDDLQQLMSFSGIITFTWNDSYIKWDPLANGQIKTVHLRHKDIW